MGLPAHRPLDLPRQILRRTLVVLLGGVLLVIALALGRMQVNVREELEAARVLALLVERLASLPAMDDEQALLALSQWREQGPMRHLGLRVVDADGRLRWPPEQAGAETGPALTKGSPAAAEPSGPVVAAAALLQEWLSPWLPAASPFTVAWSLNRPLGKPWTVMLFAEADSEQREALAFALEASLALIAVAALMLAVMAWNLKRAFSPLAGLLGAITQLRPGGQGALKDLPTLPAAELEAIAQALRDLARTLAEAEAHRQALAQQVLNLQEDERQHLARELHDEFGQRLTALRVDAAWLARSLEGQDSAQAVARGMVEQAGLIQQDIRAVLRRLQPLGPADPLGSELNAARLATLLQELVAGWRREGGPQWRLTLAWRHAPDAHGATSGVGPWPDGSAAAPARCLPAPLALTLYRISQEAMTNVARHAQARQAELELIWSELAPEGSETSLVPTAWIEWAVRDDGNGLPSGDAALALRRGNGLAGIQERLWSWGAELTWGGSTAVHPGLNLQARVAVSAAAGQSRPPAESVNVTVTAAPSEIPPTAHAPV